MVESLLRSQFPLSVTQKNIKPQRTVTFHSKFQHLPIQAPKIISLKLRGMEYAITDINQG